MSHAASPATSWSRLPAWSIRHLTHATGVQRPVDVAAFAVYNRLVIALHASKLAQSSDGAVVHGSF